MIVALLKLVIVKGAHVAPRSQVVAKWNEVNDSFYQQEEYDYLAPDHYVRGEYRKLQDKYKQVLREVKKDQETGNKSGKSGEISELYSLVKQIFDDIDEMEEEKNDKVGQKHRMEETESSLLAIKKPHLPQHGWGKRKLLNGSSTNTSAKTSPSDKGAAGSSFEQTMMAIIQQQLNQNVPNSYPSKKADEDLVKQQMLSYIQREQLDVESLFDVEEADEETGKVMALLKKIQLRVLVGVYCTRGKSFSADAFYEKLSQLNIPVLYQLQIYDTLEQWRTICLHNFSNEEEVEIWSPSMQGKSE